MEDFENLNRVLEQFVYEFKQQLRDKIVAENAVASGDLLNSIDCRPPYDSTEKTFPQIEKWVMDKPLQPYPDSRGKLPTIKQVTFLVARKISEEGTQGHYFFESTLNGLMEKYYPMIVDAIYKDIEKDLEGLI